MEIVKQVSKFEFEQEKTLRQPTNQCVCFVYVHSLFVIEKAEAASQRANRRASTEFGEGVKANG